MVMGRFGRKKSKEDGKSPVSENENPSLLENDLLPGNNEDSEDENEEAALLKNFFQDDNELDAEDEDADGDKDAEDDNPLGGDLMDIFTSEETEESDLAALTKDLEDVEIHALLQQARQVVDELRRRSGL